MRLDMEIGKRKDVYPSKKVLNLYYKEDKTTRPSTIALYVLFFAVVVLALAKILVFDLAVQLADLRAEVEEKQTYYDNQIEILKDYRDISSQYSRYSFSYLHEDEILCDRMEVLAMLEATVYKKSEVQSVSITEDVVSVNFTGPDLEETAALVKQIENYELVASVEVSTATLSDTHTTRMVITLVNEAGGDVS